jgi:hypothetical protein
MTVEVVTDRDGEEANSSLEKEEMLRHESFPTNNSDQYYELPTAAKAHPCDTDQAGERALFSQSVEQAP